MMLLQNVTNAVWHAFSAMQGDNESVPKSKLKVLTANFGAVLDLYGVERGLEDYRSTPALDFQHFKYYLFKEVFSSLSNELPISTVREYEEKIEEICWDIYSKGCCFEIGRHWGTSDSTLFQLFRIFCLLADMSQDKCGNHRVTLAVSEAGTILSQLISSVGLEWHKADFEAHTDGVEWLSFNQIVLLMQTKYRDLDKDALCESIDAMAQILLGDVIKKGILMKKGYLLPTLREYWFVLKPTQLTYYKTRQEKHLCGVINLNARCSVTSNLQRIILQTNERTFEFATHTHRIRLQWLAALKLAIKHSGGRLGYQRTLVARRRLQRQADNIERERKDSLIHDMNAQLEAEKMARVAAQEAIVDKEKQVGHLEALLEEETQAKKDEEIVRALQARVLREEWEKREELERLQEEQRALLEEEKEKRMDFERRQKEKEIQLNEAERKLALLEGERRRLDAELNLAQIKISSMDGDELNGSRIPKQRAKIRRSVSMLSAPFLSS